MTDMTLRTGDAWEGPRNEGPGEQVGPYLIVRRIGEGGFGAVFEAEQEQPVKRRVALKVIKLGMDTEEVIARFEAERQALAMMDHPNIARVLDAGATASGRPYFVMELVEGEPISDYCDANKLSVDARLALFDQVCTAVQHAHTKGVIHRDLKPSNVLVSTQDGMPFAKVIDFGIAKATSGRLTDRTLQTELNQVMGTPLYMSPEQAEGSADIDTRTDVYSLGVMLYELLTGSTPVPKDSLRSAVLAEIQRLVCEVDPPLPSTRLAHAGDTLRHVATRRSSEPGKLTRTVRGELDWIVMKALEKDRGRRYETANGLAMDIRRYRKSEPVLAAPPSASYRLQKFVRRNRVTVAAGSLVAASLLAGIVGFAWQARIAQARAAELEKVSAFQAEMLKQVDPADAGTMLDRDLHAKLGEALAAEGLSEAEQAREMQAFDRQWRRINATDAARDLIDRTILKPAVQAVDKDFGDQPLVAATLRQALASRYHDLAMHDAAKPLQMQALATRRQLLGDDAVETLNSMARTGKLLLDSGEFKRAQRYSREALAGRQRVLGPDHKETLETMHDLGYQLMFDDQDALAEPLLREALERRRRVLGPEHADTLVSMDGLGHLLVKKGEHDEAVAVLTAALAGVRKVKGEYHADTLKAINNLGIALYFKGDVAAAEPYVRESLEKTRRVRGEQHKDTIESINNHGAMLKALGRFDEAEATLRESLRLNVLVMGVDHPSTLSSHVALGSLLVDRGKLAEAEPLLRIATEGRERVLGADHPTTDSAAGMLGRTLFLANRFGESEPFLRRAFEGRRKGLGANAANTVLSATHLAELLVATGHPAEAEALLAPMEPEVRAAYAKEKPALLGRYLASLGHARAGLERFADAERLLLEAVALIPEDTYAPRRDKRDAMTWLVAAYAAWEASQPGQGHQARAEPWRVARAKLEPLPSDAPGSGLAAPP